MTQDKSWHEVWKILAEHQMAQLPRTPANLVKMRNLVYGPAKWPFQPGELLCIEEGVGYA